MATRLIGTAVISCFLFSGAIPGDAFARPAEPTVYTLEKETTFQRGCFEPCMCPIMILEEIRGTFVLTLLRDEQAAFRHYAVTDVSWVVPQGGAGFRIRGSGSFDIIEEFAATRRLALDLEVGDDPVEHFDSGHVPGPSDISRIDLPISIHGMFCFDTAIDVHARPATTLAVDRSMLTWNAMPGATGYDVMRGDLAGLPESGGDFSAAARECLADDRGATWLPLAGSPTPGAASWFLIRPVYADFPGTWDSEGDVDQAWPRDAGISASGAGCP